MPHCLASRELYSAILALQRNFSTYNCSVDVLLSANVAVDIEPFGLL